MPCARELALQRFHAACAAALSPERITLIQDEDGTVIGGVLAKGSNNNTAR